MSYAGKHSAPGGVVRQRAPIIDLRAPLLHARERWGCAVVEE
jgi:hypothetical protein